MSVFLSYDGRMQEMINHQSVDVEGCSRRHNKKPDLQTPSLGF